MKSSARLSLSAAAAIASCLQNLFIKMPGRSCIEKYRRMLQQLAENRIYSKNGCCGMRSACCMPRPGIALNSRESARLLASRMAASIARRAGKRSYHNQQRAQHRPAKYLVINDIITARMHGEIQYGAIYSWRDFRPVLALAYMYAACARLRGDTALR